MLKNNGIIKNTKLYEKLLVLVFFVVVAYIYLGADIFSGEINAPMDLLLNYPGFSESGISTEIYSMEKSDILDSLLPSWIYVREEILSGDFPLWNPLKDGGKPTFLSQLIFRADFLPFLIFGDGLGFTLGLIAKLVIAGFGTYLLCRQVLGAIPSTFAGITFMMSGFMAVWLMWPQALVVAWVPWVLWSLKKVVDKPSAFGLGIVSLTITMLIIGGFPYLSVVGFYLGLLFFAWLLFLKYRSKGKEIRKAFSHGLLGIFFGILLASVYIVPLYEWQNNVDVQWRSSGSHFSLQDVDVLWNPFKYNYTVSENLVPKIERTGYIGLLPITLLPLAVLGLFIDKRQRFSFLSPLFWMPISLITLILTFNVPPISSYLYQLFPFDVNTNSRAIGLLGLQISILSAFGLQQVMKGSESLVTKLKIKANYRMIAFVVVSIIFIIQIIDISTVGKSVNTVVSSETFFPPTTTLEYVKKNLIPGQSVIATDAYLISGTLTGYGIPEWFAHGYFSSQEKKVLSNLVEDAWKTPTSSKFTFNQVRLDSDYMNALMVRYVLLSNSELDKSEIPDTWKIISKGQNITILENKMVPPGAYLIPEGKEGGDFDQSSIITGDIEIVEYSSNYMKYFVTYDSHGTLVLPHRIWSGWNAYVNGQPTEIIPFLQILSSVKIDSNPSIVELKYEPYSHMIVIILSTIAILALFSFYLYDYKQKGI